MNQTEKEQVVEEVRQELQRASVVIVTRYRGLKVADMTRLRREMHATGTQYRVIKNTLARRATQGTSFEGLTQFLTGPTGVAISADPVAPAKVLAAFAKKNPMLEVVGGVLNGTVIDAAGIGELAKLPSKEVLVARLLGTMMAPIQNFVGVLSAVPAGLVRVLDRIRESKETSGAE
ncbi:MAG: 50S ribosomal protein L10 [Magnetococcales bacterium]|nr:50S ribosomal protein L10 [Magnetococcales bacterium]